MNQLVTAVQLEANIIGQQLWIGSFFARPHWSAGQERSGLRGLELSVIPHQV